MLAYVSLFPHGSLTLSFLWDASSSTPLCFVNLPPGGRLFLLVNLDTVPRPFVFVDDQVPGPDPENHISTREPGPGCFLRGLTEALKLRKPNFLLHRKDTTAPGQVGD